MVELLALVELVCLGLDLVVDERSQRVSQSLQRAIQRASGRSDFQITYYEPIGHKTRDITRPVDTYEDIDAYLMFLGWVEQGLHGGHGPNHVLTKAQVLKNEKNMN